MGRQHLVQPPLHGVRGKLVGKDDIGNRYYVQRKGVGPLGVPRRWVIYKNLAEASKVPPEWHGWMHYTGRYAADRGELRAAAVAEAAPHEHDGHARGLPSAGSILAAACGPKATGDYKPWRRR